MSKHSDRALELFKQGYNCSQAVFCAFCDEFNMVEETALRVSAGLGGGVGRMREVCGTVTGAALVIGMLYGATNGKDTQKKKETYEKVQEITEEFKKDNPSIICRELLGLTQEAQAKETAAPEARTEHYYKKRPCSELVENMAKILDEKFFEAETYLGHTLRAMIKKRLSEMSISKEVFLLKTDSFYPIQSQTKDLMSLICL